MYRLLLLFCALLCGTLPAAAQASRDTLSVFFAFNDSTLNRTATAMLDSVRYDDVLNPSQRLLIIGYTDFVGTNNYNDHLSRIRAQAVKNYLLTLGFRDNNVQLCIGKGEIAREGMEENKEGYAPDRRVDIVILNPVRQVETVYSFHHDSAKTTTTTILTTAAEEQQVQHFSGLKKDLSEYTKQETFRLENLHFPPNRHYLENGSEAVLDTLYTILKTHPGLRVRIEGHVCCVTDLPDAFDADTHTYNLSVNRAKFIRTYLIGKGIYPQRLEYAGFGRSMPLEPVEVTQEQARRNRRVEIRILSQ